MGDDPQQATVTLPVELLDDDDDDDEEDELELEQHALMAQRLISVHSPGVPVMQPLTMKSEMGRS